MKTTKKTAAVNKYLAEKLVRDRPFLRDKSARSKDMAQLSYCIDHALLYLKNRQA
jgi:hypothetical protein